MGARQRDRPGRQRLLLHSRGRIRVEANAFRGGDNGLTLIAWGTREPNDICWYPRSRKISWAGVGVVARVEPLDYWDGED